MGLHKSQGVLGRILGDLPSEDLQPPVRRLQPRLQVLRHSRASPPDPAPPQPDPTAVVRRVMAAGLGLFLGAGEAFATPSCCLLGGVR